MGKVNLIEDMNLPSGDALEALFSSQEERDNERLERVMPLRIDLIHDFHDHPFKVRDDEEMVQLIDSVRQNGLLMPALVRPDRQGGYEMVSGHRRKRACELAALKPFPALCGS